MSHDPATHIGSSPVPVICVAAGKGGVGKSMVSCALAQAMTAAGCKATVIDLDLQGPSLPALLGLPPVKPKSDGLLPPHRLPDGSGAFSLGQIFSPDQALHFGEVATESFVQFLAGNLLLSDDQVLIADMPPGTSLVQNVVNRLWQPRTLLVTTGAAIAHADLRRAWAVARNPIGLVENLTRVVGLGPEGQPVEARLYNDADTGALAESLGTPFMGSLPYAAGPGELALTPEMTGIAHACVEALRPGH